MVCQLIQVCLEQAPPYDALSYTWGTALKLENLYHMSMDSAALDSSGDIMEITQNLHGALVQLRDRVVRRRLWVDAVCIDQANIKERGEQVQIMRRIFTNATHVWIWLGLEESSTSDALQAIAMIDSHREKMGLSFTALKAITDEDPYTEILGLRDITIDQRSTHALHRLFSRPWFRRIWVVQEVNVDCRKVEVLIGPKQVPWNHVGAAALWLGALRWSAPKPEASQGQRNAMVMWQGRMFAGATLPPLLDEAREYLATDAHDKVFALLGFPSFQRLIEDFGFSANYTHSVSELYKLVAILSIKSTRTLEILSYVDHSQSPHFDVETKSLSLSQVTMDSSWVPRWDMETPYRSFPLQDYAHYRNRTNGVCTSIEPKGDAIQLNGLSIGDLLTTAEHIDWISDSSGLMMCNPDVLIHFWKAITQHKNARMSNEYFLIGLSHAMTAGLDENYGPATKNSAQHVADFIEFLLPMFSCEPCEHNSQTLRPAFYEMLLHMQRREYLGDRTRYSRDVSWICTNRRLFYTSGGFIGLGPSNIRANDVVAVLFGGHTPFLLRPRTGCYQLIGEAYVYGMMDGEAMEWLSTGRFSEQLFLLR